MNKKSSNRQRPQRDNRGPSTSNPRVPGGNDSRRPAALPSDRAVRSPSGRPTRSEPANARFERSSGAPRADSRPRRPTMDRMSERPGSGAGPSARSPRSEYTADDGRGRSERGYDATDRDDDGTDGSEGRPERVIYGIGPVRELLTHFPQRIVRLLIDERRGTSSAADPAMQIAHAASAAQVIVSSATRAELDAVTGPDARHQGVAAILGPFTYFDIDDVIASISGTPLWIALDGVEDPRNLGAIIRTAYLLGAHGVIIPEHRAASVTAVTAKASAGASELLPIVKVGNLARALQTLKDSGVWTMAVHSSEQSKPMAALDCKMPICIVLGAEGTGVRPLTAQLCDFHAVLPMVNTGVGSFNVSVAAAMALYEIVRQRA
jgi:23S rRNA (guanosine2251-2'-O)-methyltransferase